MALLDWLRGWLAASEPAPPVVPAAPGPAAAIPVLAAGEAPLVTVALLRAMCPAVRDPVGWAPILSAAARRHGLAGPCVTAWLANVLHETGGLSRLVESLNYSVDGLLSTFGRHRISEADARRLGRQPGAAALSQERQAAIANLVYGGEWGRLNLGNVLPGDGWRFRGRGCLQTTGRRNHARFALTLGVPLDDALLARMETREGAADSAAAWWAASGCRVPAAAGDIGAVRRLVNGGALGLAEVRALWEAGRAVA